MRAFNQGHLAARRRVSPAARPAARLNGRHGAAEVTVVPIATVNPTNGEQLKSFDPLPPDQIDHRLARAESGFNALRPTTFAQRAAWMLQAASILDAEVDNVAALMTTEMGKTLASAKAEVAK